MPLPDFNLDDRTFQDLVDECKRLIPKYCPEWTDHNLSDPGVTLIELFAWMTEQIIFRLNKVPRKNYVKFLEMVGGRLMTATPATADVTFTLSAAQERPVTVPRGTEVATVRTETEEAIVFCTDEDLTVVPPTLAACLTSSDGSKFVDRSRLLRDPDYQFEIFDEVPQPGNACYLGFKEDLSRHKLAVSLLAKIEGIGVDPRRPPLRWQAWSQAKDAWVNLDVEDGTGGFNRSGEVVLHVPRNCAPRLLDTQSAFWIRCVVVEPEKNKRPYSASPRVSNLRCYSMGGMAAASHGARVFGEALGVSSGEPAQSFHLQQAPVLPRSWSETIEVVSPEGVAEPWTEVEDFSASGPEDAHFTLDSITGEVGFGPNVRRPDGRRRQYGRVPTAGSTIRFKGYRHGGGIKGNVGSGTLSVLKSSLPLVDAVTNRAPAAGGAEAEDLDHAMLRVPRLLKTTNRAVTAEDYEFLARQASPAVARAHCIQPRTPGDGSAGIGPGIVHVYVVPALPEGELHVKPEMLSVSAHVHEAVHAFLDERRLLTTILNIGAPDYVLVSVELSAKARSGAAPQELQAKVEEALYRYLHPLFGGPQAQGWPFGRDLFLPEVYALVQRIPGVDYLEEIRLYRQSSVEAAEGREGPFERISFEPGQLPCSLNHAVVVK